MVPITKVPKSEEKFRCITCDYYTSRNSQYNRHLATDKHKNLHNPIQILYKSTESLITNKTYSCLCGKIYKHSSTLYAHKKKCVSGANQNIHETTDKMIIMTLIKGNNELIKGNNELIKENNEFKTMLMEQQNAILKVIENGTHNTTNNISNKTFNLNFFLNETCKDAMNIMDFVDSIQLQLSDLENVGKLGYVEGISNIITKNLKALDVSQRPVHCADKKREVLYVKDENKWEKEDETKNKIRKAIKRVASKNQRLIPKFKEAHPDCGEYSSPFSDQFDHIIIESMGGSGDNDVEKEDKIIKKISSVTIINK